LSNSPDLNPIENIWAHKKYRIFKEIWSYYFCEGDATCSSPFREELVHYRRDHLIESMPDRIEAMIKAMPGSALY